MLKSTERRGEKETTNTKIENATCGFLFFCFLEKGGPAVLVHIMPVVFSSHLASFLAPHNSCMHDPRDNWAVICGLLPLGALCVFFSCRPFSFFFSDAFSLFFPPFLFCFPVDFVDQLACESGMHAPQTWAPIKREQRVCKMKSGDGQPGLLFFSHC